MVQNYMEILVRDILFKEFNDNEEKYADLCKCPSCLAVMQAEALNRLDPFYVTCVAGEVYGEYRHKEQQHYSDILVAISLGIEAAAKLPHNLQNTSIS